MQTLDVRNLPAGILQDTVVRTLDGLGPGDEVQLVSDHDPFVLRHQVEVDRPGRFSWAYVVDGPTSWTTAITCVAAPAR